MGYRLFLTCFSDISDLTSRFLWSQIFAGFCNVILPYITTPYITTPDIRAKPDLKALLSGPLEFFFSILVALTMQISYVIFFTLNFDVHVL